MLRIGDRRESASLWLPKFDGAHIAPVAVAVTESESFSCASGLLAAWLPILAMQMIYISNTQYKHEIPTAWS